MTKPFIYQYSEDELAMAQAHAKRSIESQQCPKCNKYKAPTAQWLITLNGPICWVCYMLEEHKTGASPV